MLSGLTAFPLQSETSLLARLVDATGLDSAFPALDAWVHRVSEGVADGYGRHPFLAYGTDWLAFAPPGDRRRLPAAPCATRSATSG
ncbi:hypothetical protein [Kitasatospora fiedleri]|uniref:hypothetical protein n=1 Tax=Kitasatospora fiedleri TaxID=2991545 RepID=UPI002989D216|nr:hypothetical protein [Kitasatospora fiedleri]